MFLKDSRTPNNRLNRSKNKRSIGPCLNWWINKLVFWLPYTATHVRFLGWKARVLTEEPTMGDQIPSTEDLLHHQRTNLLLVRYGPWPLPMLALHLPNALPFGSHLPTPSVLSAKGCHQMQWKPLRNSTSSSCQWLLQLQKSIELSRTVSTAWTFIVHLLDWKGGNSTCNQKMCE